ncbi:putative nucleotidyltransferase [Leptolyngbya sp. PCC 7375]|nr:putative nucleotidyltransferase [Leptolyngbya sp. PCC 7375]
MVYVSEQRQQQILQRVLAARARKTERLELMKQRQQEGLEAARTMATCLKQEFSVTKVVLFGSLLEPEYMTSHSDIDLAVWGLDSPLLFKAGAAIDKHSDFEVDLIEFEKAPSYIQEAILQGLEL